MGNVRMNAISQARYGSQNSAESLGGEAQVAFSQEVQPSNGVVACE